MLNLIEKWSSLHKRKGDGSEYMAHRLVLPRCISGDAFDK